MTLDLGAALVVRGHAASRRRLSDPGDDPEHGATTPVS